MSARRRATDAGLTIVELMITLIIASIVTASTFVFFVGQQRIYDTQTKILNVQQNVWAAMETVTRFVRAGGTGMIGCVRPDFDGPAGPDTGDPPPVGAVAPATGLRAFRNGQGVIRIPPLWITNGAAGAPDMITVAFGNGTFGNYNDTLLGADVPANTPTAPVTTPPGLTSIYRPGEFILLVDIGQVPVSGNMDRGCTLFQITGIDSITNSLTRSAGTSPWNPAANVAGMVPWVYDGGGPNATGGIRNFGQLNWVQFSIAPATASEPPRLMMNRLDDPAIGAQVLAEGIEDMQIAYACDTQPVLGDGVLTEGVDNASRLLDEWMLNQSGDPISAACNKPSAVRITFIARSLTPDDTLRALGANRKPAVEDGALGNPDTFRHRVISTTVFPRN